MWRIGQYEVDVLAFLAYLVSLSVVVWLGWAALARLCFRFGRFFPSIEMIESCSTQAENFRTHASDAWRNRGNPLREIKWIGIGIGFLLLAVAVIMFNLSILARIFDYLFGAGIDVVSLQLPFVGYAGEFSNNAVILALIFALVEAGLGITLFFLWPVIDQLKNPRNEAQHQLNIWVRLLRLAVLLIILGAVGFEGYMNYLQAFVAIEESEQGAVVAGIIGTITPLGEILFSAFFWHLAMETLLTYGFSVLIAVAYWILSVNVGLLAFPHRNVINIIVHFINPLNNSAESARRARKALKEAAKYICENYRDRLNDPALADLRAKLEEASQWQV